MSYFNHQIAMYSNGYQRLKKVAILFLSIFFLGICSLSAQLAQYATSGGNSSASTFTEVNTSNTPISIFSVGTPGSACSKGFSTNNWTNSSVMDTTYYEEFSVYPDTGFQLDISGIYCGLRSSSTGPRNAQWYYSLDGGLTWSDSLNVPPVNAKSCQRSSNGLGDWAFSTTVTSHTLGIKFRIYAWQASGRTGTFQMIDLTVDGTVSPLTNYKNDAAAISIDSLPSTICPGIKRIVGKYKNAGTDTLKSVATIYEIDGVIQDTLYYKDTIAPGSISKSNYFGSYNFKSLGTSKIKWYSWNPNGMIDSAAYNDTITRYINVISKPNPKIIGKRNLCLGDSQIYTQLNNPGDSFVWNIPSSLTSAYFSVNYDSLDVKFNTAGNYVFSLKGINAGCSDSTLDTIRITPAPVFKLIGKDTICNNVTKLDGTKINGFRFTTSLPISSRTVSITNGTYTNAGADSIYIFRKKNSKINIVFDGATPSGCKAKLVKDITIISAKPLKISGKDTVCSDVISKYNVSPKYNNFKYYIGTLNGKLFNLSNTVGGSKLDSIKTSWSLSNSGTGFITAYGEDSNGCIAADTNFIKIRKMVNAGFSISQKKNTIQLVSSDSLLKSYSWKVSDTTASLFGKSISYLFKKTGNYKISLIAKDSFGCQSTLDTSFNFIYTGIQDEITASKIGKIYPNPITDVLYIESTEPSSLQIIDMNGKIIYRATLQIGKHSIPTAEWPKGIYNAQLVNTNSFKTSKIVKF